MRRIRPRGVLAALLLASLFGGGCAAAPKSAPVAPSAGAVPGADGYERAAVAQASAPSPAPASALAGLPATKTGAPSQTAPSAAQAKQEPNAPKLDDAQKPLLIYEGALGVRVPKSDIAESIEKAIDVAEGHGGYLVSRSDSGVQLRVPSPRFRLALKELGGLGEVTRRSVSAQDVSEQYHDLEVRLRNLESVRTRLEQFLARAANVDEALRVGKELEAVVRQIDEAKGRMQYLKTRASYSLITLAIEPAPEKAPVVARDDRQAAPPARPLRMPVKWIKSVGLDGLLSLE